MDTMIHPSMCVHQADGTIMQFTKYKSGLYFHNTAAAPKMASTNVAGYSFILTV